MNGYFFPRSYCEYCRVYRLVIRNGVHIDDFGERHACNYLDKIRPHIFTSQGFYWVSCQPNYGTPYHKALWARALDWVNEANLKRQ